MEALFWFDKQKVSSILIRLLQGPLATAESEFSAVLDMRGIAAGSHEVKIEMSGIWSGDDELCLTTKGLLVNYTPQTTQSRLAKIPIIKSVTGMELAVINHVEKEIYLDMQRMAKQEKEYKRDKW